MITSILNGVIEASNRPSITHFEPFCRYDFWTRVLRACNSAFLSQIAVLVELGRQCVFVRCSRHAIFVSFAEIHVTVGRRQKKSARCSDRSARCIHSPSTCALTGNHYCIELVGINIIAYAQPTRQKWYALDVPLSVCFLCTHFPLSHLFVVVPEFVVQGMFCKHVCVDYAHVDYYIFFS